MARTLSLLAGLALLATLPLWAEALGQCSLIALVARIMIYAIAAASLNLILGYGGLVSFGHAAFFGLGAYAVGILYFHHAEETPLWGFIPGTDQLLIGLPVAILVSGLAALAIGALALRTGGVQFIMITLAFAQMLFFLFVALKTYGGEDGLILRRGAQLFGLNLKDKTVMFYIILTAMVVAFGILWRVVNSSFGAVLAGLRQNERRMSAMGIEPFRYRLAAFVLSGMGAGLAGGLMAVFMRFASPDYLNWAKSGDLMIMVILGGVGSFLGPLWGAAVVVLLETWLSGWTEHWQLVMGIVLLLVVLFARGGLSGLPAALRRKEVQA